MHLDVDKYSWCKIIVEMYVTCDTCRHLPHITNKLIYDFSRVLRCAWDIVGDESVGFSTGFGKEWRQVWKETCQNCRDTSPQKSQKGNKNERLQYSTSWSYISKKPPQVNGWKMKFPFGARHIFRFHVSFQGENGRFEENCTKERRFFGVSTQNLWGSNRFKKKNCNKWSHLWPLFWKEWKADLLSQKDHE